MHEAEDVGIFTGTAALSQYITHGRKARLGETAGPPLSKTATSSTTSR